MLEFASNLLQQVLSWLIGSLPSIAKALAMAFAGWLLGRFSKSLIDRTAARLRKDAILWGYVGTLARYLIMALSFTVALRLAGLPIDSILAAFGISGVIIGLGARQSIANYFAGMMMLAAKPFKQGDVIEFGPPLQIGRVREVRMTYTAIDTLDNVRMFVPNAMLWRNKITNFSVHAQRAIRISLGVPFDVDLDWVEDIALDTLRRHPAVLDDPPVSFTASDVTSNNIRALVVAWSNVDSINLFGDIITRMRSDFATAGMEITLPVSDIDLKREE